MRPRFHPIFVSAAPAAGYPTNQGGIIYPPHGVPHQPCIRPVRDFTTLRTQGRKRALEPFHPFPCERTAGNLGAPRTPLSHRRHPRPISMRGAPSRFRPALPPFMSEPCIQCPMPGRRAPPRTPTVRLRESPSRIFARILISRIGAPSSAHPLSKLR